MSNKKSTEKLYVVIDGDNDFLGHGTWNEIVESLEEYNDGWDEYDEISFAEWVSQCEIYELGASKKLKYTPSKFEIK